METLKIERLMLAMAEHEGWHPAGVSKIPGGSRSYRHHNPLNLTASPFQSSKIDGFSVFNTDMDGFFAARWDIVQKIHGKTTTGLTGKSTLKEFIYVWDSGDPENVREAYLLDVCTKTGFPATMKLEELL